MSIHEIDSYSNTSLGMMDALTDVTESIADKSPSVGNNGDEPVADQGPSVGNNGDEPVADKSPSVGNNENQSSTHRAAGYYKVRRSDKSSREFIVSENNVDKMVISTNRFFHGWNVLDWRKHYNMRALHTDKQLAHAVRSSTNVLDLFRSGPIIQLTIDDCKGNEIVRINTVFNKSARNFQFKDRNGNVLGYLQPCISPQQNVVHYSAYEQRTDKLIKLIGSIKPIKESGCDVNSANKKCYKLILNATDMDKRPFLIFAAHLIDKGFLIDGFEEIAS